jgi:formate hydrogenlyase subunit 6/NADH:ubiquinone oxidoreductase subunit I
MTIATMLQDVLASLVRPPATEKYPFERQPVPVRLRGKVAWDPEQCTGCQLCTRDCPAQALELTILDRKAKRFVMHYQVDRCLFCSQCASSCARDAIWLSHDEWELAALNKEPFDVYYGADADVQAVLADTAGPDDDTG